MSGAGSKYRPDIDGLRAIAVAAVVGFHALPALFPGGFVGVDIFFVISGYLITGVIAGELAAGTFTLQNFYLRRMRRIFPALAAMLVVATLIAWACLLPDEWRQFGKHLFAGAAFVSNLALAREGGYFAWARISSPCCISGLSASKSSSTSSGHSSWRCCGRPRGPCAWPC